MTDLPTGTIRTNQRMSFQDYATAYTCSQRNHDDILLTFSSPKPHLAKGCYIGIISQSDFQTGQLFHFFFNFLITPSEIRCILHNTHFRHRSRNTDSYSFDLILCNLLFLTKFLYRSGNIRKDRSAFVFCVGWNLPFFQKYTIDLEQSHLHSCSANIYAKTIFHNYSPCFLAIFSCTRLYNSCAALYPILFCLWLIAAVSTMIARLRPGRIGN